MKLDSVQSLIQGIAENVSLFAQDSAYPVEAYQPLVDALAALRLSYGSLESTVRLADEAEHAQATNLLIESLDQIRCMLVLPAVMLDRITKSRAHTMPFDFELGLRIDKSIPRSGVEALGTLDIGDVSAFSRDFSLLLRGVIDQVEEWGELEVARTLSERYSSPAQDV